MPSVAESDIYEALLNKHGAAIANVFLGVVSDIKKKTSISRLSKAIEQGNIGKVVQTIAMSDTAFEPLSEAIRSAYIESGQTTVGLMPDMGSSDVAVSVRFSVRNTRAEKWLMDQSSKLVTNIMEDQQNLIQQVLATGLARGDNPTQTAIYLAGGIVDGRRVGGVIGLTTQQEMYVSNLIDELSSGDKSQMENYFNRSLRDKRYDPIVQEAIDKNERVNTPDILKLADRYRDNLQMLRGETIARTETLTAVRSAKNEAFMQGVDSGAIDGSSAVKYWRSAGDNRVRDSHAELDGTSVPIDQAFVSPSGSSMQFPGDTSLGADADEIINCRCDLEFKVDYLSNIGKEEGIPDRGLTENAPK